MSNKKQSSVEWLIDYIKNLEQYDYITIQELEAKAKAMHKEEMKDCYLSHVAKAEKLRQIFEKQFEQYYNETFGETKN